METPRYTLNVFVKIMLFCKFLLVKYSPSSQKFTSNQKEQGKVFLVRKVTHRSNIILKG